MASSLAGSFVDDGSASRRNGIFVQKALELQESAMAHVRQGDIEKASLILAEVVKMLDSRRCNESARMIISEAVDGIVQALCGRAFQAPASVDRVLPAVNALQLQLSSTRKLSAPYAGVPKQTLSRALNALTSMDAMKAESTPIPTPVTSQTTKMCFRILQRLITGVGVRPSDGQRGNLREREINQVLNVFSNLGRMDMAHRIVALQERTRHAPPLSPVAFSILIKGYGRQRDLSHMEEVVRHAQKNKIRPDIVLLNTIIDTYNSCNEMGKAQRLFDDMRGLTKAYDATSPFPGVSLPKPNKRTYNIMLKGFAKEGQYDEAVSLSQEMNQLGFWDAVTTNTLVQAAVVAKQLDAAERILAKYTVDPEDVDPQRGTHPNVESYTQLLDCYAKEGDMNQALEVMRNMRARGVSPNVVTYTCLIAGFGRTRQLSEAKKLLVFMKQKGVRPSTITYNALISGLLEGIPIPGHGDPDQTRDIPVDDGLALLRDMMNDNIRPNSVTASLLVGAMGLCEPPRVDAAIALVDTLESKKIISPGDVQVYTAMVQTCGQAGDIKTAVKYFRALENPDLVSVNAFMYACHCCYQPDLVKDTFNHFFHAKGPKHQLRPDLISYSVMIDSTLRNEGINALREAQSLYITMKKKFLICPDTGMIDTVLKAMIKVSRTRSLAKRDVLFVASVLRDAERLAWPSGQLERRRRAIRSILGDTLREASFDDQRMKSLLLAEDDALFKRKGWNKVDSGFKLWGQGDGVGATRAEGASDTSQDDVPVDEFLESHGWNNVESGFRLL